MVYAGANTASFQSASNDLKHLAELEIRSERVRRATLRNGKERCELARALAEAFEAKSLPEQRGGPSGKTAPQLSVVMSDGGRYQRFDRSAETAPDSESFWKESRVGILLSMKPQVFEVDPTPELPDFLKDVSIAQKLASMGKVPGENTADPSTSEVSSEPPWHSPELLSKDVVASGRSWKDFGPLLASSAWYSNFYQASHRVFVSDGSSAIEEMQGRWFSRFTSILDLMHALSYSLAAARAIHSDAQASWATYVRFATAIWQGRVDDVIKELEQDLPDAAPPDPQAPDGQTTNDARERIRQAIVYYRNHRDRMNYPKYRKAGYPLTSSLMESTVKQINKRVKGSEKFWSTEGGEALLRLRADYLSDSKPMDDHWKSTTQNASGCRAYKQAA